MLPLINGINSAYDKELYVFVMDGGDARRGFKRRQVESMVLKIKELRRRRRKEPRKGS